MVKDIASVALKDEQVRPHLPVNLSPRDSVSFSNESHEFLQVPRAVDDMLSPDLAVIVDIGFGFTAVKHLPLAHCEQLVTISALVQIVVFFFQK